MQLCEVRQRGVNGIVQALWTQAPVLLNESDVLTTMPPVPIVKSYLLLAGKLQPVLWV